MSPRNRELSQNIYCFHFIHGRSCTANQEKSAILVFDSMANETSSLGHLPPSQLNFDEFSVPRPQYYLRSLNSSGDPLLEHQSFLDDAANFINSSCKNLVANASSGCYSTTLFLMWVSWEKWLDKEWEKPWRNSCRTPPLLPIRHKTCRRNKFSSMLRAKAIQT